MTWADSWLPLLEAVFWAVGRASLEGGLFAGAVWAVVRLVPALPASARAALWWIACARFAVSLVGLAPLTVPLVVPGSFDQAATATPLASVSPAAGAQALVPDTSAASPAADASGAPAQAFVRATRDAGIVSRGFGAFALLRSWPWTAWVALAWLGLVASACVRVAAALVRSAVLVRTATPVDRSAIPAISRVAEQFGLTRDPDVRVSDAVRSPQLVWAGHGVVLLPSAAIDSWTPRDVALALAHEFAHLRRRDLAWGLAASVAARAFAFHPLARLAAREYALAREAACDAEVLARTDASPFDYGTLLLALGVARRPALSLSSAAWSARSLKRRLVMLEHHSSSRRFRARWIVIPAALVAGLVGLTAAAPDPQTGPEVPAPALRDAVDAPAAAIEPRAKATGTEQTAPPAPPRPPAEPRPPAPPPPPPPPPPSHAHGSHGMDDVADAWVYLSEGQAFQHGSRHDRRIAEGLRKGPAPIFWFARDGKEYVVRDTATLDRIEKLLAPEWDMAEGQRDLAESQATLAHEQALIAAKQAEVASRAAEIGAKQAALGAEEARLRAESMAGGRDEGVDEAKAREIEARVREFEKQMQSLEVEMRRHEEHLHAFEPEHEKLAREMEKRARALQARAAKASRELKNLLTQAIASGVAQTAR